MTHGSAPSPKFVAPAMSPLQKLATKRLGIKEVAARFERGEGFDEYRTYNLLEENTVAGRLLQQSLAQLPIGQRLLGVLLGRAQDLRGRVAGKNKEDAEKLAAGISEIQAQWSAHEASMKTSLQEAQQAAKNAISAAVEMEAELRLDQEAHIAALEAALGAARLEVEDTKKLADSYKAELVALQEPSKARSFEVGAMRKLMSGRPGKECSIHVGSSDGEAPLMEERIGADWGHPPRGTLRVEGRRQVGATLQVVGGTGAPASLAAMQWMRQLAGSDAHEAIAGAVRCQYSPEPADAGCRLACRCDVGEGEAGACSQFTLGAGLIEADPGVDAEVATLAAAGSGMFNVVVVQVNGEVQRQKEVSSLHVSLAGVALLGADGSIRSRTGYTPSMQVCGARGGGDGAAQGVFLAFAAGQAFMLACESSRQRNACITLIRSLAAASGLGIQGPSSSPV